MTYFIKVALLTVAIASATTVAAYAQDIILLRDGTEVDGRVVEVLDAAIKYHKASNPTGPLYTLPVAEIFMVTYGNGEREVFGRGAATAPAAMAPAPASRAPTSVPSATPQVGATAALPAAEAVVDAETKFFTNRFYQAGRRVDRATYERAIATDPVASRQLRSGRNLRTAGLITWGVGGFWTIVVAIADLNAQSAINDANSISSSFGGPEIRTGPRVGAYVVPGLLVIGGCIMDGIGSKRVYRSAETFNASRGLRYGLHVGGDGVGLALTF